MFIIVGGAVIVAIVSVTGEEGVIITVIVCIIVIERLNIAAGKDKFMGIATSKGVDTVDYLIRHGEGGQFLAENSPS